MQTYFNIRITFLAIEITGKIKLCSGTFLKVSNIYSFSWHLLSVTWGVCPRAHDTFSTILSFYSICQDFVGAEQEGEIGL